MTTGPGPDERGPLPYVHVAEVLVLDGDGKVLLVRNLGRWWLPGGRVEAGETFAVAAAREVPEETGIEVDLEGVVAITEWARPEHHVVFVTFRGRSRGGEIRVPGNDPKVDAVRWADLDEADRLVPDFPGGLARIVSGPIIDALPTTPGPG